MGNVRLICCDVDGTLARDDKSISDVNIEWIKRAINEKHIKFVIVSGRMYSGIVPLYNRIGVTEPLSALNGAILYDEHGTIIRNHKISKNDMVLIIDILREFKIETLIINENRWYTEKQEGYLYSVKRPIYQQDSIMCSFNKYIRTNSANKILCMSKDSSLLRDAAQRLNEENLDIAFYYGKDFIEMMPGGVNKGSAIDDLSSYYDIDKSDIMALGDDFNDIDMLEKAGYSVAMGNAAAEIKGVAQYITDTNEKDGVAKALERIVFGGECI